MRKRKSVIGVLLISLVCMAIILSGCGQTKLSDKFNEDTVKSEAMKAIEYFNARNYQSILDMGSDELKASLTVEQFATASDPYLDKCGEFKEISKTIVLGNTDKNTGAEYGGVVMIGKYASGSIQFTIAFDESMKLVQFVIK